MPKYDEPIGVPEGSHFESYDSFDQMQAALSKADEAAFARITDWQRNLKPGQHWVRVVDMSGEPLVIFGKYLTDDETYSWAKGKTDAESLAELRDEKELTEANRKHGYYFCNSYSLWEPRGELGDVHASTIHAKLTEDQFKQAEEARWDLGALIRQTVPWAHAFVRGQVKDGVIDDLFVPALGERV